MDVISELCIIRDILLGGGKRSKTSGNFFVLTVGNPMLQLYFTTKYDQDSTSGIPAGTIVRVPKKPVSTLIIVNEGNADILYEVNCLPQETKLGSILRASEDVQIDSTQFSKDIFSVFMIAETPSGPNVNNAIGVGSANGPNWGGTLNTAHIRLEARY